MSRIVRYFHLAAWFFQRNSIPFILGLLVGGALSLQVMVSVLDSFAAHFVVAPITK